jgi:CheY-like chemotaxis protein
MGKTILLVDDEPDLVKLTSFRLTHAGYEVITTSNGTSALEVLGSKKIDLVLLDIHLTGMNGYELCKIIRADDHTKNIPILFFSASSLTGEIRKNINELKAQGFVQKPFDHEELASTIQKFI